MSTYNNIISDIVRGDSVKIPRSVDISGIAPDTLAKAWLTVKVNRDDADLAALIQKTITASATANGQIDVVGDGGAGISAHLYFQLSATDTNAMTAMVLYYYDIKAKSTGGATKVIESGRIKAGYPITLASS
jgi:hypothetical protein